MKLRIFAVPFLVSLLPCLAFAQGACSPTGASVGSGSFNHTINWELTGDLYFNINNGPHNACGALVATRNNGSEQCTPGWVCTDANGNASKGPWTWAGQNGDETGTAHINWPDGTTTYLTTNHYWDKTCPTPSIGPGVPGSFTGTGTDGAWGAGFSNAWTIISLKFYYHPTGKYWNPNTGDYTDASPPPIYGYITSGWGTIGPGTNDSPSYFMHWTTPSVPSADNPGVYTWTVSLGENESTCIGSNPGSTQSINFRVTDRIPTVCGIDVGCP